MSDGWTLIRNLRQLLSESTTATWPDVRTSYDFLYQAAIKTADRLTLGVTTQTITTVADQANYALDADFLRLYLTNEQGNYFIKYTDASANVYFIYMDSYDSIILANNTTSVAVPWTFTIREKAPATQIAGAATATAATFTHGYTIFGQSLGEATLTYATGGFTAYVNVGDIVHNTTDGSHGLVIASSLDTAVLCALFDGTNNYFTNADAFVINPQARFELYLDPPPLTAAETITVYYVQKPAPVYSAYRRYNLLSGHTDALVAYAAWLYKYRDREPNMGDPFYKIWDEATRNLYRTVKNVKREKGYRVNLNVKANRSYSYR